ncbi:hypothetical protein NEMBOFW57_003139 [Staphylotrichum longicolle]|uniref:Uncharacterized protein n=1 Tax=Staphylotrichum longicolle TaxID=669026 RepID=A0AAD4F9B8_9PEZI|nr:hypothetical protein NEMBOFW57_003139 [Staphylotrichum longicolle]
MASHHTKTLLKAVKTASQLRSWELNSEDIYDETEEHWKRLIKRDFPVLSVQKDFVPNDRTSWHKIYDLYKKLDDDQIAASTQKMMQDFAAKDEQKTARLTKVVPLVKYARLQKPKAKPWFAAPRVDHSPFAKAKEQLRRDAARFKLPTPSGKLPVPAGQIKKAPESMVNAARIAKQPSVLLKPKKTAPGQDTIENRVDADREAREERLRRIKNPKDSTVKISGNVISFDDDADQGAPENNVVSGSLDPDDDDLFGDLDPKRPAWPSSTKIFTLPPPAARQSAPKRRQSFEGENTEPPAKRRRSLEDATQSVPSTSTSPPPAPGLLKRRPKTLSAAPGANTALRAYKPKPAPKHANTNKTSRSSSPSVNIYPQRSLPLSTTPYAARQPSLLGDDELEQRRRRHADGSITPHKGDPTARRIMVCRPPAKLRST